MATLPFLDKSIDDCLSYGTLAERNLWSCAAICAELERVTTPGRAAKGQTIDGDIKHFCDETGVSRSRAYNLSRAYRLARSFTDDVRRRGSFERLSISHFEEASALEGEEALEALDWALDNGKNGRPVNIRELRHYVRNQKSFQPRERAIADEVRRGSADGRPRELPETGSSPFLPRARGR